MLVLDTIVAQPSSTTNAVVWGDRVMTYEQLRAQAARIGNLLRAQGVGQGDVVVLALDQLPDAVAAALAALTLGAVFVSLDPALSAARAQRIIDDSHAVVLLGALPAGVTFDGPAIQPAQIAAASAEAMPAAPATTDDPAALVYLSKSTGRLEGLFLSRASIDDAVSFQTSTLKLDLSRTLCLADYLDERSLIPALSSLAQGGTVYFTPLQPADGSAVEQTIRGQQISTVVLPLAALPAYQASAPGVFTLVKHLLTFGDDLIDCDELKQTLKGSNVSWHNYYGFPEFQFISTIKHENGRRVHEGKPAPQVQAYILDPSRQLVAVGLPGELYVAGSGVFTGFASSPALQQERFCDNPFMPGQRLYRTGCTAKWQPNRRIEIVSGDEQELISNGRRVALAEVEATLAAHPKISACSVVPRTTTSGAYITAFVVSAADVFQLQLDGYLAEQLGHLPLVGFAQVDRLLRTADGQIDRQQLAQLPVLDSVELQQAEQQLRVALKSDDLALLLRRPTAASSLDLNLAQPAQQSAPARESERLALAIGAALHADPDAPSTLAEALVNTAERYPAHGVRYLAQDGHSRVQMYPILLMEAQQILAGLRAHGVRPGDHLLFQLDRSDDLIPAFWACVLGGFVAVPLASPATYAPANPAVTALHNAWSTLNQPVLLSRSDLEQPLIATFAAAEIEQPQLLTIEELRSFAADPNHHPVTPEATALLLLTSGTSGVALNHRDSIAQVRGVAQLNGLTSADVSLNWLPLDQAGGALMAHVRDVCTGCFQLQAPHDWISQNTLAWLNIIEQYRATVSWAPSSAFAAINDQPERVNAVHRDLASLRLILNEGETVSAQTARTFLRLLKPHRLPTNVIRPAYSLAETGSSIAYSDALSLDGGVHDLNHSALTVGDHATGSTFVEVGQPIPGLVLRIVDGDNQLLREGTVGRVQVQGLAMTSGSHTSIDPERLTDDGWFITGDLGFLLNGRLTITGRETARGSRKQATLTDAQHDQLRAWNATATEYPRQQSLQELFEAQAAQTPDAVAISSRTQQLTYAELNRRANQLAHHLRAAGVTTETLVGICIERSPELIVGLLAILKAGGAYVPLDPNYPSERLAAMLHDIAAPVLLVQHSLRERLPAYDGLALCIDTEQPLIGQQPTANPARQITPEHLAYVMFTSGSTGRPKGIGVTHRSVVRLVKNTNYIAPTPADVFLQLAPSSFDASTFEIWGALLNGARLAIMPPQMPTLEELGATIRGEGVTTLWLTAGLFHQMVDWQLDALAGVRNLLAGGDVLSTAHVSRVLRELPDCTLINGYGPTENTTFTCCYPMSHGTPIDRSVPIGRPIANTEVYVLDAQLQPVPIGEPGELYTGGDGLARGYLGRPELTAERFVPHPFSPEVGARLYRTGDLVRYLADGTIEFLGRVDRQVKMRGFRIEPGEIEAVLHEQAGVQDAVVLLREDRPGDKRLVAYVVPKKNLEPRTKNQEDGNSLGSRSPEGHPVLGSDNLRQHLGAHLPEYMVPSAFVVLDALLLTPNGKIDRQALPAPEAVESQTQLDHSDPEMTALAQAAFDQQPVLKLYLGASAGTSSYTQIEAALKAFIDRQPLEIYQVERLPRAVDGLVDVVQLERLGQRLRREDWTADMPTNEIELELLRIWQEVLGTTKITIYDNFFALGGHSLLATQLVSRLRESFNVEIQMQQLFAAPTISGLAQVVVQGQMEQIDEAAMSAIFAEVDGLTAEEIDQLLSV